MADSNGIIFKNPTLNTWFISDEVDTTAGLILTVSDSPGGIYDGNFTFDETTGSWKKGAITISLGAGGWLMTDGSVTEFTAVVQNPNFPPKTFTYEATTPSQVVVSGAGTGDINGTYNEVFPQYYKGIYAIVYNTSRSEWVIYSGRNPSILYYYSNPATSGIIPKTGWVLAEDGTGDAPTIEYSLPTVVGATISVPDVTWISNNPVSGFVSYTDTPDGDFGYVITFDVQGGVPYANYKYCTKTAGEVYGTLPVVVREGFIFAGWYTSPEGQGTRIEATDELLVAADDILHAKWVKNVTGKVGSGASLVSLFVLGIGTDLFCEYIGSRLAKILPQTIIRKLPKS